MARFVFRLPDVGEGTAEAEIVAWHVKTGDAVAEDQPLVDVMTDKATVEIQPNNQSSEHNKTDKEKENLKHGNGAVRGKMC